MARTASIPAGRSGRVFNTSNFGYEGPVYGGEYWTKMLLDRTIRCITSNLPVYCLTVPGMLLCRTR